MTGRRGPLVALVVIAAAVAGGVTWWLTGGPAPPSPAPPPATARAIVGSLLDQLYRAVDARSEDRTLIDLVAPAKAPTIRDRITADLTRFDLDGALGVVSMVTLLDLKTAPGDPGFAAEGTWLVASHVSHEGHSHGKIVEYDGSLSLVPSADGAWRIADFTVTAARPMGADPTAE